MVFQTSSSSLIADNFVLSFWKKWKQREKHFQTSHTTAHTSKNTHCLPSCLCRWKICALGTGCPLPSGTMASALLLRTLPYDSAISPLHWGILADAHAPCYFFYDASPLWPHLCLAQVPLSSLSPVTIPSQSYFWTARHSSLPLYQTRDAHQ